MAGVFTFPLNFPFIDALAAHVLAEYGGTPERLSELRLLLPSRRACTAFREACLRRTNGAPLLLPRMQPLADAPEEMLLPERLLAEALGAEAAADIPDMAAVSPLQRQVMLTRLVFTQLNSSGALAVNMEQAALLAQALGEWLDDMAREELSPDGLDALVPEELSHHWQQSVRLLKSLALRFPAQLAEEGRQDAVERRNRLLSRLSENLIRKPPPWPVIAAGSTGSQPATARLLSAIAKLPQGTVILPGFDVEMDRESWEAVEETHPQFMLKSLLSHMEISRSQVSVLPVPEGVEPACGTERIAYLRDALLPAECSHRWREAAHGPQALAGVSRIDCGTPGEEARTVALLLREALETPGRSAAVVTHDRLLARQIAAEIRRYGISIDDSAGMPLMETPPGAFLLLLAEMAVSGAAPVPLLSVLKHPLAALGREESECRAAARALEMTLLRGVRIARGFSGMRHALAGSGGDVEAFLVDLQEGLSGWLEMFSGAPRPFDELLGEHLQSAERMAANHESPGAARLWAGEAGRALAEALAELHALAPRIGVIEPEEYPALLRQFLGPVSHRPAYGTHPRLRILSPIEARLQRADLFILAGMNEGSWPPEPEASPWMSRPMQRAFGLPVPERVAGQAAHDFFMLAAAAPHVVLTRAQKSGGSLADPSRFLLRLDALRQEKINYEERPHLHWARALHRHAPLPPLPEPVPAPPVSARPRRLSVTEMEALQRDPYGIYARHVLGLRALDALDKQPDAAEFGTMVHAALEAFARRFPGALPEDARAVLLECGRQSFAAFHDRPAVRAYWWPRFEAMADFILRLEAERRAAGVRVEAELRLELKENLPGGEFLLVGRVDRLERLPGGGFSVVDYKTGGTPAKSSIESGVSLQLALEAWMLTRLNSGTPESLEYWKLAGARGECETVATGEAARRAAEAAGERFLSLIEEYSREETPYRVQPNPALAPRYNDYTHLERQAEWES